MSELTPFERHVIEDKGTEPAFSGLYTQTDEPGDYLCKRCNSLLYHSTDKFSSHCGWPSFDDEVPGAVQRNPDADGRRIEIVCAKCKAHLGHVFEGEGMTPKNVRHCVNSVSLNFKPKVTVETKKAVLASGCFWGTQYYLARVPGVLETKVGYIDGHVDNPTYKQVCSGNTGHVEATEVTYDPSKITFKELLQYFFETHDFSQEDGQGPDIGSQYLSVVFYENDQEKKDAEEVMGWLRDKGQKVATQLKPMKHFWAGEDYHQLYYEKKGDTPYCHRYREIFPR